MNINIVEKVLKRAQEGEYGATGIKVELEAQLDRGNEDACSECDGAGSFTCQYCEDGYNECAECDRGIVRGNCDCSESCCEHAVACEECEDGYLRCPQHCDEGRLYCDYCDGEQTSAYGSNQACYLFILRHVAMQLGTRLSELRAARGNPPVGEVKSHELIDGLVYAMFYNDGSVDSELTFTVKPEAIHLIPMFIKAFRALAEKIGNGMEVSDAGMHMALLHSEEAKYPGNSWWRGDADRDRFDNFRKAMRPLLPALYFLASSDGRSRGMGYRKPGISCEEKYLAIAYRHQALEFRVFDTCYDEPERALDNLVVMCNAVNRYWKLQPDASLTVDKRVYFGNNAGGDLERLYVRAEHFDLLNQGLRLLKPSYYTITELKQQRKFAKTKHTIRQRLAQARKEAAEEYKRYENAYNWHLKAREHELLANYLSDLAGVRYFERTNTTRGYSTPSPDDEPTLLARAMERVKERLEIELESKLDLTTYINKRLEELTEYQSEFAIC